MPSQILMMLAAAASHSSALSWQPEAALLEADVTVEVQAESAMAAERTQSEDISSPVRLEPVEGHITLPDVKLAFEGISDEELFDRAASSLDEMTTIEARFEETSPYGDVRIGKVYLRRPGQFRMEYDGESEPLLLATGNMVYTYEEWSKESTSSYPLGETPLRYVLTKRLNPDEAVLDTVVRQEDRVSLVLSPKDTRLEGQMALIFTAPDMTFAGWAMLNPNGEVITTELTEIKAGHRLSNRLFATPDADDSRLFTRDR